MNKFIIIFVVLLQSCFENAQDSTGHNTVDDLANVDKKDIETETTLFQQIRSLGLNPIEYPTKQSLMKAIVDRAIKAEKEKADAKKETLVMKAKYSFPSVMQNVQNLLSPGWIDQLGKLTRNTIWTIISNRKDSLDLIVLLRRIRACYPFRFTIEDIKEFVLKKFSSDCTCIHGDWTDFPRELNENEWKDVLSGMDLNLWDPREECIVRSMTKHFEMWELEAAHNECKAGYEKNMTYDGFMWLGDLPIHHSERAIKTRLEIHLTKYDQQLDGKVINVIKLVFVDRKDLNEAVVQFINEVSMINAMNVLYQNPLILENCKISACEIWSGTV